MSEALKCTTASAPKILTEKELAVLFISFLDFLGPLSPLLVSQISSSWRRVALQTSALWTRLELDPARAFAKMEWQEYSRQGGEHAAKTENCTSVWLEMGFRPWPSPTVSAISSLELAKLWISRAGDSETFELTTHYATGFVQPPGRPRRPPTYPRSGIFRFDPARLYSSTFSWEEWVSSILALRPRLRSLTISARAVERRDGMQQGILPIEDLTSSLVEVEFPLLETLRTPSSHIFVRRELNFNIRFETVGLRLPALLNITIMLPHFVPLLPLCSRLTALSVYLPLMIRSLRFLPEETLRQLRTLKAILLRGAGYGQKSDYDRQPDEVFILPSLQVLDVPFTDLTWLRMPVLRALVIHMTSQPPPSLFSVSGRNTGNYLGVNTVRSLKEAGSLASLDRLNMKKVVIMDSVMHDLLYSCSALRVLQWDTVTSPSGLRRLTQRCSSENASFSVGSFREQESTKTSKFLCPNLRVVEVRTQPMKATLVAAFIDARYRSLPLGEWSVPVSITSDHPAKLISLKWDGEECLGDAS